MGLGGRAEVGLDGLVAREGLVGFLIGDDSGDDDVVALLEAGIFGTNGRKFRRFRLRTPYRGSAHETDYKAR